MRGRVRARPPTTAPSRAARARAGAPAPAGPTPVRGAREPELRRTDPNKGPTSFTPTADSAVSIVDVATAARRPADAARDARLPPVADDARISTRSRSGSRTSRAARSATFATSGSWTGTSSRPPLSEYVTVNRGTSPPAEPHLLGRQTASADNLPVHAATTARSTARSTRRSATRTTPTRAPPTTARASPSRSARSNPGQVREFFLYYGAAGNEDDADAAVSAAALELFSYGQPNFEDNEDRRRAGRRHAPRRSGSGQAEHVHLGLPRRRRPARSSRRR